MISRRAGDGDRTPRHLAALVSLLAAGQSNDEIATGLVISKHTAEKYVSELKRRVGARDRVDLVLWCHQRVEADSPVRPKALVDDEADDR